MVAKQLSVFIENRQGRLHEVLDVLKTNGVNILSLSLADTTEYGLLRLIVSDLKKGKERTATCEDVLDELDFIETPYTNLLLSLESYIENENKLSEAYEKDDQTLIDRLEQKEKQVRESIQNNITCKYYVFI